MTFVLMQVSPVTENKTPPLGFGKDHWSYWHDVPGIDKIIFHSPEIFFGADQTCALPAEFYNYHERLDISGELTHRELKGGSRGFNIIQRAKSQESVIQVRYLLRGHQYRGGLYRVSALSASLFEWHGDLNYSLTLKIFSNPIAEKTTDVEFYKGK